MRPRQAPDSRHAAHGRDDGRRCVTRANEHGGAEHGPRLGGAAKQPVVEVGAPPQPRGTRPRHSRGFGGPGLGRPKERSLIILGTGGGSSVARVWYACGGCVV